MLETSQFWRDVMIDVSKEYADVELSHMYVDNAAMQLVKAPKAFDVIVTGNMFGDILSDEAAMLTGSIGMLPSASLDKNNKGLYEPSHGSAPDIAGKGVANPLATILSAAMMLRYSLNKAEQADRIETAVKKVLEQGYPHRRHPDAGLQAGRHGGNGRRGCRRAVRLDACCRGAEVRRESRADQSQTAVKARIGLQSGHSRMNTAHAGARQIRFSCRLL